LVKVLDNLVVVVVIIKKAIKIKAAKVEKIDKEIE